MLHSRLIAVAVLGALCAMTFPSSARAQDAPMRLSGAGESCTRTADCQAPLRCKERVCRGVKSAEGETCAKAEDCEGMLFCVANSCRRTTPQDASGGAPPRKRPVEAHVIMGLGGGVALTGIILLAASSGERGLTQDDFQIAGGTLLGAGLIALIAGIVVTVDHHSSDETTAAWAVPWATSDTLGLSALGRF